MKKILGISLVAMMAVTAANADIASKAYVNQQDTAAIATAGTNADTKISTAIGTLGTREVGGQQVAYPNVKTYVDEKVAAAESVATGGISGLDATETQTGAADNGWLNLSITEADGVITDISGSITADKYDAYGAAATAEQNAKDYADGLAGNYEASGAAAAAIEALDATVSQTASTDGLALSITEADGVITAISGSIAAETYDRFGAAAAVAGNMVTVTSGEGYDKTSTETYPSMATAAQIASEAASSAVNSSVTVSASNGVSASVSNGAITMAGTDATTSAKGVMQVGTDLAVANGVVSVDKSTTVASADTKPVSSGAVYTALHNFAGAPVANDTDGVYALTAVVTDGVATYHWELIERGNNN